MMAVFFFIAHKKGFLAHAFVLNCSSQRAEKDAIKYDCYQVRLLSSTIARSFSMFSMFSNCGGL